MTANNTYPFDKKEFSVTIKKIEHANSNVATEQYYNEIATSLLLNAYSG